jgi:hypothetical protein
MKLTFIINFRPFNDSEERRDAGYYNGLNKNGKALIEINSNDPLLEQILTLFHEITHAIFDFLVLYQKSGKKWVRRAEDDRDLKTEWKQYEGTTDKEEEICMAVEENVKATLLKLITPEFITKLFHIK